MIDGRLSPIAAVGDRGSRGFGRPGYKRGRGLDVKSIVIVGAGHAGAQAAASLREEGFTGALTLLSDEAEPPYQRPPLSKAFLKGEIDLAGLPLRAEGFFRERDIDLRLASRRRASIAAKSGELGERRKPALRPSHSRHRRASARVAKSPAPITKTCWRCEHPGRAFDLQLARAGQDVVVVGAGFIGLEIAATASSSTAR